MQVEFLSLYTWIYIVIKKILASCKGDEHCSDLDLWPFILLQYVFQWIFMQFWSHLKFENSEIESPNSVPSRFHGDTMLFSAVCPCCVNF